MPVVPLSGAALPGARRRGGFGGARDAILAKVADAEGVRLSIPVGTMIELPRAALTAFRIAEVAEFFSFGTNDLTQTTWGFSRDDVEAAFFAAYLSKGVSPSPRLRASMSMAWPAGTHRRRGGEAHPTRSALGGLWRARRRSRVGPLLPPHRHRLRVVFAVPGPYRPARGRGRATLSGAPPRSAVSGSPPTCERGRLGPSFPPNRPDRTAWSNWLRKTRKSWRQRRDGTAQKWARRPLGVGVVPRLHGDHAH